MDASIAVTTIRDADDWSPGWASAYFLYLYLERKNDFSADGEILNSPRQLTWLVEQFDAVYSLLCDNNRKEDREAFFNYQEQEHKRLSDIGDYGGLR